MAVKIGDEIVNAQRQSQREGQELFLTLPSGGVLSLLNRDEIAQKVRLEKEREETAQKEISSACSVATKLVESISDIEHFFVAGNPEFVATAQNDRKSDVMKAYSSVVRFLQTHLKDGSVEEHDGEFRFGAKKPHCVVPSRLSALQSLTKLTSPRQENGDELRALTMAEITKVAANLNAVKEVKVPDGPHLKIDHQFFGIGDNNEMTEEYSQQFQKIVGKLITANKALVNEIRKQQSLTLHEQVTVSTIEEALEKGGIYLATIPDCFDDGRIFFGGHVLFLFTDNGVTIGGNYGQLFADGNHLFYEKIAETEAQKAEISYKDVEELLKADIERPNGRKDPQDYRLWCYVRSHINWLRDYRYEKAIIAKMKKDDDLAVQNFLDGQVGSIVLTLESFSVRENKISKTIYAAAIRVSRSVVGSDKALQILEVSPAMMPFVSNFIGEEKVFPENNLPGILAKFVSQWKKEQCGSN